MKSMNDMIVEQSLNTCNTAKQYESLAPSPDHGCWIEWKGGECPVPAGTLVDLRYRGKAQEDRIAVPALTFGHRSEMEFWHHDSCALDIIAWRLHQPEQAAWNGQGLPPVGTECEWQDKNTKHWQKVTVVYASEWVTVIREDKNSDAVELAIENYGDEKRNKFRPIRTEAERKREESIKYISHSLRANGSITDEQLNRIYEDIAAGKIPGVKLED